ncbi:MAG: tyramine oxidase, partial [Aldersonia sp.]|nr:tyramine oxidase [Aldersonia sp.]
MTPTPHPLDRLTADEIRSARRIIDEHGLLSPTTRFPLLALEEPPKAEVLAFRPGDPIDRRVRALWLDVATGAARSVVASLTRGVVDTDVPVDPAVDGQPPIMLEELQTVDEIVKADVG